MNSFWVLVSGFCFAVMGVFVKLGSEYFSSAELVFYRSFIGLIFIAIVMRVRKVSYHTDHLRKHVARGVVGCFGLILYFYTMAIMPLAMAVTLNHTAPIFFAIIVAVIFSEKLKKQSVIAIGIGFVGVVLLLRPSVDTSHTGGVLIGLLVGFIVAVGYLYIRHFGQVGEPESRTVLYYSLVGTISAGVWVGLTEVHALSTENLWILVLLGLSATFGQLALTRAYKTTKSILTTSLTYINVLFASIFGIVIWGEVLPLISWIAFALIVCSGILASTAALTKKT